MNTINRNLTVEEYKILNLVNFKNNNKNHDLVQPFKKLDAAKTGLVIKLIK